VRPQARAAEAPAPTPWIRGSSPTTASSWRGSSRCSRRRRRPPPPPPPPPPHRLRLPSTPTPSQGLLLRRTRGRSSSTRLVRSPRGGKLAFSLKKAKVAVAPVFAADDDDEDVEREEPAKRQKSAQADTPVVAGPAGVVGNHLLIHLVLLFSTCVVVFPFLVFIGVLWFVLCCCHQMIRYKNVSHQSNDYIQICDGTFSSIIVLEHHSTKLAHFSLLI